MENAMCFTKCQEHTPSQIIIYMLNLQTSKTNIMFQSIYLIQGWAHE